MALLQTHGPAVINYIYYGVHTFVRFVDAVKAFLGNYLSYENSIENRSTCCKLIYLYDS